MILSSSSSSVIKWMGLTLAATVDLIHPPSRPVNSILGLSRYSAGLAAFSATMMAATFPSEPGFAVVSARHGFRRGGRHHILPHAATSCGCSSVVASP